MLIFFLNLAVEYNKSRDMNNEVLERLKEEYGEDDYGDNECIGI